MSNDKGMTKSELPHLGLRSRDHGIAAFKPGIFPCIPNFSTEGTVEFEFVRHSTFNIISTFGIRVSSSL